jgi:osmoprotectant transport system substrate-binding protein
MRGVPSRVHLTVTGALVDWPFAPFPARLFTPEPKEDPMRKTRTLALGAAMLALVLSACSPGGSGSPAGSTGGAASGSPAAAKPTVKVGSAGFYEAAVVGEMYAQALEAKGFTVERHLEIGERPAVHQAMESGDVNLIPEYLGGLAAQLNQSADLPSDAQQAWDNLQQPLKDKGWVEFGFSPGTDADGFAVRAETAQQFNLATMSDIAKVADQLVWGVAEGCPDNPVCGPGLKDKYGIDLDKLDVETEPPCGPDIITALNNKVIDVAQVCTTQPDIVSSNLTLLEDDQHLQPAQNIVGVATKELADAGGTDLSDTIDAINEALTTDALTQLGVEINVNQKDIADVARDFLDSNGLI